MGSVRVVTRAMRLARGGDEGQAQRDEFDAKQRLQRGLGSSVSVSDEEQHEGSKAKKMGDHSPRAAGMDLPPAPTTL